MFTLFVSLGLIVGLTAVGILTLLTMSATGHLINEVQGIRADLTRLAYLQGGCTQEIAGRLDDAASDLAMAVQLSEPSTIGHGVRNDRQRRLSTIRVRT